MQLLYTLSTWYVNIYKWYNKYFPQRSIWHNTTWECLKMICLFFCDLETLLFYNNSLKVQKSYKCNISHLIKIRIIDIYIPSNFTPGDLGLHHELQFTGLQPWLHPSCGERFGFSVWPQLHDICSATGILLWCLCGHAGNQVEDVQTIEIMCLELRLSSIYQKQQQSSETMFLQNHDYQKYLLKTSPQLDVHRACISDHWCFEQRRHLEAAADMSQATWLIKATGFYFTLTVGLHIPGCQFNNIVWHPVWQKYGASITQTTFQQDEHAPYYPHKLSRPKALILITLKEPCLRFDMPEDGFPSIEDWIYTFTSILMDGLDLQREPLDVSAQSSVKAWCYLKKCHHLPVDYVLGLL